MSKVSSGASAPAIAIAMNQPVSGKYFPALDYLRFVLALLVMSGHAGLISGKDIGIDSVQTFFAMSGWLIGGVLLKTKFSDIPKFYFNRAARIWIPYVTTILLLVFASLMKEQVTALWLKTFFYELTFVYNLFITPQIDALKSVLPLQATGNHFWSLCAEEQFYLIAPFALTIPVIGQRLAFWCILSCVVLASPLWHFFGTICLGVTASVAVKQFGDWHTSRLARAVSASIAITGMVVILFDLEQFHRIIVPISSLSIVLLCAHRGPMDRVGTFIGGMSFQLYLTQWIGVFVANLVFAEFGARGTLASMISSLFISVAIAANLYVTVDLNIKKHRNSFYSDARAKVVTAIGFALIIVGIITGFYLGA